MMNFNGRRLFKPQKPNPQFTLLANPLLSAAVLRFMLGQGGKVVGDHNLRTTLEYIFKFWFCHILNFNNKIQLSTSMMLHLFYSIRCIISWFFQLKDGSKVPDKLEFWLHIREIAYLVETNIDLDNYSNILSSTGLFKSEIIHFLPQLCHFDDDFPKVRN